MKTKCPRCAGAGEIDLVPLAVLMERKKMKQADLCKLLDIKQPAASYMTRTGRIAWRHRATLAAHFKISREQLIGSEPLDAPRPPARAKKKARRK